MLVGLCGFQTGIIRLYSKVLVLSEPETPGSQLVIGCKRFVSHCYMPRKGMTATMQGYSTFHTPAFL